MKPAISVIIVSWNAKNFLEQCLGSIMFNKELDCQFEVIVVDNASTDGSVEMVTEMFPAASLISNPQNFGFAKANNIGIKASKGEYLYLINSDVVVRPYCFSKMLNHMKSDPDIGLMGPRIIGSDGNIQRSCMGYPSLWNSFCRALLLDTIIPKVPIFNGFLLNHWGHDSLREVEVINGCFWLFRRKAIEEVGLLDDKFFMYAEDIDICKRINSAGWKIVFFPYAEALHYGGGSSMNAPVRFYIEMQKANLKYYKKHHTFISHILFYLITVLHQLLRIILNAGLCLMSSKNKDKALFKARRSMACMTNLLAIKGNLR